MLLPSLAFLPAFNKHLRVAAAITTCVALILVASASFTVHAQGLGNSGSFASSIGSATGRLMKRIGRLNPLANEAYVVLSAEERARLLAHELTVHFTVRNGGPVPADFRLRMADHPDWIAFNAEQSVFALQEHAIRIFLEERQAEMLPAASNALAETVHERWGVERFALEGIPREGYRMDVIASSRSLLQALEDHATDVTLDVTHEQPTIFARTASGTMQLSRLSRGISTFKGSPWGREANVRKALTDHLNGVIIQPGEAFSFTEAMRGGSGWRDAYVIGAGGELIMEPGGGICQAVTTAFRAAILAGLPIEERANHSLYVSYYRAYGVGIDATYYPGKQDFSFRNDTAHPIVMVAYAEGKDAVVELYGIPDGRSVEINGPYFSQKKDALAEARALELNINQIGWLYDVTYPSGATVQSALVSTYKAIPRKLRDEYGTHPGIEELLGRTGTGGMMK